ncbi:hypothetical protein MP477_07350 [Chryseobacterium sp. WG23]|uniref:hypothetical protein n=1 Tax=Chryseobacterium sp. WG23 TaxID=2926910 RepID=UPI00211DD411|nr:hypothetical protein [Chryseobacterium sp. WG23]MCQ9634770.1 hypothetical protein [Chryseobacterium sp. WG23]
MNTKLDTILFYVKNIEVMKNFNVENFNVKVIEEDPVWVLLDAGGVTWHFIKSEISILKK